MRFEEIPDWLPTDIKEIYAKMIELQALRNQLVTERKRSLPLRQSAIDIRLIEIKQTLEMLRIQRMKSSDGLNGYYSDIVRQGLGESHRYIHQRILAEAASRAEGNSEKLVNIFPDDMMDALSNNQQLVLQKMNAEARVHRIIETIEQSKLSMKGELTMAEFDRRQAFNRLIDKLIHQINQK